MITEITNFAAATAADLLQKAVDELQDAEMELEDTLEQYDTLMYGDAPAPEDEDRGQVIADLLWDARDLYAEAENLLSRVQDFAEAVEKATA